jgi:nucleoside-diphosphate-sugar epimerase/carbamoylphosphate synthase large subunit
MNIKKINLAVSCAGSGIGQSIINSCKLSDLPLVLYGFDSNPLAYGLYCCDYQIQTPKIDTPNYIELIIQLCVDHAIDIIIPGTDDEVHLFSKHISDFENSDIKVIVAEAKFLDIVRDKVLANIEFGKMADIFVKSYYTKESLLNALEHKEVALPVIAKPRSGSGSVGIRIINKLEDLVELTAQHIFQELAVPHENDVNIEEFKRLIAKNVNPQVSELSIQLVVGKTGVILGKMATFNRLKQGVPVEIMPFTNPSVWVDIDKLIPTFVALGLKGPLNIQGRMTDKGLKIFEMNARFTGITGLRATMGFNEVEACIKEWLGNEPHIPQLKVSGAHFGIRQTTDMAVDITRNSQVENLYNKINEKKPEKVKTLLITGATGFLGRNLIDQILIDKRLHLKICVLTHNKQSAKELLPEAVTIFDHEDLRIGTLALGGISILLHLGFARPHKPLEDLAESLAFSSKLFRRALENHVSSIINISSQSVYGLLNLPPWKETMLVAPNSPYALAKYSSELLLRELSHQHKHIHTTSIRLAGIAGGAKGFVNVDLVSKLIKQVKEGTDLKIAGGHQQFERMDIRDTVLALLALLKTPSNLWKPVYNLGADATFTLNELAESILRIGHEYCPNTTSQIIRSSSDQDSKFGMDVSLFKTDMKWAPKYTIDDTIQSLFAYDY